MPLPLTEAELAELEALTTQSEDLEPGAARRRLEQLTPTQKLAMLLEAAIRYAPTYISDWPRLDPDLELIRDHPTFIRLFGKA